MSQHTNFLPIQYRRHQVLWFVLLLLGVGAAASAASELAASRPYWTGRVEQDTTWRDTVYVGGDVTIAAAATLTLAPNTKVLFLPYRDDVRGGLDTTRAELIVAGRLAAHTGGIVFRSADAGSLGADWYGLVVERGGRADVSNAVIRDGLRCVYAKRGGFVRMDAVAFANCGKPTAPADIHTQSAEPVKPSVEPVKRVDSYFLNDRAITRIPTKVGVGMLTALGAAVIAYENLKPNEDEDDFGDPPGLEGHVSVALGLLFGYPVGVYLADPVESSFWMTCVVHGVGFWWVVEESWVAVLGVPVVASELSRLLPKRFRNPNPFKWLFGKFGQPTPRASFGLVPDPQRGLSARATLRF